MILLSDRSKPDYANSIKESITAVEAACNIINGTNDKSLGQALKVLDQVIPVHSAFRRALEQLYGYTSGADGIRHFTLESSQLDLADARFWLISCSTIANYLKAKAVSAGLAFN